MINVAKYPLFVVPVEIMHTSDSVCLDILSELVFVFVPELSRDVVFCRIRGDLRVMGGLKDGEGVECVENWGGMKDIEEVMETNERRVEREKKE